jgi:hypothetical protein
VACTAGGLPKKCQLSDKQEVGIDLDMWSSEIISWLLLASAVDVMWQAISDLLQYTVLLKIVQVKKRENDSRNCNEYSANIKLRAEF